MLSKILSKRSFSGAPKVSQTKLLINGKFVNSASGETFKTYDPATEQVIAEVQRAGTEDVDRAVAAARHAFDHGPWRRMSGYERGRCLERLADLMEKNKDELAALEALDNGKTKAFAGAADVPLSIKTYQYYGGWADKIHGKTVPISGGNFFHYTRQEPVGVCAQIIPWNFPLLMQAWKLGPALACGNTVVMKTAEQTPLSAARVGELIMEAGFPEGVVNILSGFGEDAGRHLSQHALVDKVAFTGSTEVGYEIMRTAHKDNLKRITLELGGKSANIIMDDADMDLAIQQSQVGLFLNHGQCCIAGSRVFVHEKIYDEFVAKSVEAAKSMKVGNQFDATANQGPQIDGTQMDKILGYIESGKKEGAKIHCGGNRVGDKGFFVEPTVFSDVTDDMKIAREEIFGPVMSIMKFNDIDDVIKRANDSEYGLGAGLCTNSMDNAFRLVNGIRAGTVYVNCYDVFDATTTFGGFKDSGIGRELGEAGLHNYLESKTVIMKMHDSALP
jgi:aldehyde dehydrogenase (NAD+)